ncbi:hypothetical protein Leryth_017370 [Lithospermum erythrorhizon]|nr:hypothetical protein Leryth_017370 [Lithospermum erythrorhizon]
MASQRSFYKIVLFNDKCNDPRLRIPQKIVEQYESQLSDPVKLMVPTGGIWKVGLEKKVDQTVWLHGDGLLEFVQKNSIKFGYFLLSKYGGNNSNFNVQIFDWSAMEIQNHYPNHQWNPPPSFEVTMKL